MVDKLNEKEKKSILILGGAGYIGTVVVDFLKKNYKVTCIDNLLYGQKSTLKSFKENKNFIFLNIDLRDRKKLIKFLVKIQ